MPPLRPISTRAKSALADVVARAEHQRLVDRLALVGEMFRADRPRRVSRIDEDQVFVERCRRGDHLPSASMAKLLPSKTSWSLPPTWLT